MHLRYYAPCRTFTTLHIRPPRSVARPRRRICMYACAFRPAMPILAQEIAAVTAAVIAAVTAAVAAAVTAVLHRLRLRAGARDRGGEHDRARHQRCVCVRACLRACVCVCVCAGCTSSSAGCWASPPPTPSSASPRRLSQYNIIVIIIYYTFM